MHADRRFTGIDLGPLPYESAIATMVRFSWRNCLSSRQFRLVASDDSNFPLGSHSLDWINSEKFEKASTWKLPTDQEQAFCNAFQLDQKIWLLKKFRYCPICLEHGYHSYLHQFLGITCCPLHMIPLQATCHQCDRPTPDYKVAQGMFDHAYECVHGHALSGALPSLDLHLIFREQSEAIMRFFTPVYEWALASEPVRQRFARLRFAEIQSSELVNTWCNVAEFTRSTCLAHMPAHLPEEASAFTAASLIQWRIRAYEHENTKDRFPSQVARHERIKTPNQVYRCVIRSLYRWILRTDSLSPIEFSDASGHLFEDISKNNPRILALFCLRSQLEKQAWSLDLANIDFVQLSDEPNLALQKFKNRTPRLGWRAYFISLYVSWYLRILHSKDQSLKKLAFRFGGEGTDVLLASDLHINGTESWWEGLVFFPAIGDPHFETMVIKSRKSPVQTRQKTPSVSIASNEVLVSTLDPSIEDFLDHISAKSKSEKNSRGECDTTRSYRTTMDRLAIWAEMYRSKPVCALTKVDLEAHIAFLKDPEPFSYWAGEEGASRWGERWHPFRRRLSLSSIDTAVGAINSYCDFVRSKYGNRPHIQLALVSGRLLERPLNTGKLITVDDWLVLRERLLVLPADGVGCNVRIASMLLFETTLELESLLNLRTANLYHLKEDGNDLNWRIVVDHRLQIPVSLVTVNAIHQSLQLRGFDCDNLQRIPLLDARLLEGKDAFKSEERTTAEGDGAVVMAKTLDTQITSTIKRIGRSLHERDPSRAELFAGLTAKNLRRSGVRVALDEGRSLRELRFRSKGPSFFGAYSLSECSIGAALDLPRTLDHF